MNGKVELAARLAEGLLEACQKGDKRTQRDEEATNCLMSPLTVASARFSDFVRWSYLGKFEMLRLRVQPVARPRTGTMCVARPHRSRLLTSSRWQHHRAPRKGRGSRAGLPP